MDYSKFVNTVSRAREYDRLKLKVANDDPTKMIYLSGGLPNPELFPFEEAEFKMSDGTVLRLNRERMKFAQQYQTTHGIPELRSFLKNMQKTLHNPPNFDKTPDQGGMDVCVTVGSADGISKCVEMMVTPTDSVLVESPVYAGFLTMLKPQGCDLYPIESDHDGIIPSSLLETLTSCKKLHDSTGKAMPKFLYTVASGSNPTGSTTTLERKQEIYKIAHDFDFIIIEDDAYLFLRFNSTRIPSYLSIDTDGRVLRCDSFSKVISPGIRLGFVTGPYPLIERIILHMQATYSHVPSFTQVMLSDLLHSWGMEGLTKHATKVSEFYRKQRDIMIAAANKWLTGLAEWKEPQGGMFLWLKLTGILDTERLIDEKARNKGLSLAPGCIYMIDHNIPCPYVRVSFSLASAEEIDEGFRRLAEIIKEELLELNAVPLKTT